MADGQCEFPGINAPAPGVADATQALALPAPEIDKILAEAKTVAIAGLSVVMNKCMLREHAARKGR